MLCLISTSLWQASAVAADDSEHYTGMLSMVLENDMFYQSDNNYSSGISFIWVPTKNGVPDWAVKIADWVPWFDETDDIHHGYAFGQTMYTSKDITLETPPLDDRPYAGFLYGSIGMAISDGRQLDQLSLTLGVIGPMSGTEHSQKIIHQIVGSEEPMGWDTQLHNEAGLILNYQRSWREAKAISFLGNEVEITPHFGGALGNIYTYLNTGVTLRYGEHLPLDFGPPRIQPSIQGSGFFAARQPFNWYLFAGIEVRAVGRNIFLDGNTIRDSRHVDKEQWVGDFQWGAVLTFETLRVSYTHVSRSKEFEGGAESHQFGALSLTMLF
ncbi:MAG TPA: lipid A deacylase LpxR family protein [Gammaproteobacteria bacterium]